MTWPALTSRIDAFLEWLDPDPLHGLEKNLVRTRTQLQIGRNDVLDHVGDLGIWDRGADQGAETGALVGAAPDRHLKEFLAVLLDAEQADVAHVMVAAGIDAAGNVDVQSPEIVGKVEIAEAPGQLLGDRNRAGISQAAIVEARAGDDVGDEP